MPPEEENSSTPSEFDRLKAQKDAIVAREKDRLREALQGLLDAWWKEYVYFFGADTLPDNKAAFDAIPAVVEARQVLALKDTNAPISGK